MLSLKGARVGSCRIDRYRSEYFLRHVRIPFVQIRIPRYTIQLINCLCSELTRTSGEWVRCAGYCVFVAHEREANHVRKGDSSRRVFERCVPSRAVAHSPVVHQYRHTLRLNRGEWNGLTRYLRTSALALGWPANQVVYTSSESGIH